MVVDYFVLRTHCKELEATRGSYSLPRWCPNWTVAGMIAWIGGGLVGYYVHWGIASVNSLVVAAIVYYVLARLMPVNTPATAVSEA
jgi:cytosine permease